MFKKTWYKLLAWTMAAFFFFIAAGVVISMFSPGPTEEQSMRWMEEMMNAMHTSLMGWSMESGEMMNQLLLQTTAMVFPALFAGVVLGIVLKLRRLKDGR